MGAGKTTAKSEYITELIVETPSLRTLDVACNRLFSLSNAASLELVAAALRAKGPAYKDVTAAGPHSQRGAGALVWGRPQSCCHPLPQALAGPGCSVRTEREPQPLRPHSGSAWGRSRRAPKSPPYAPRAARLYFQHAR